MLHRLASLIIKEIIQFVRDPVLVAFVLIALLQIVLMGRSVSQGVEGMPVAVVDYDLTPLSRESSPRSTIRTRLSSPPSPTGWRMRSSLSTGAT